ncbi:MAG: DUF1698 domain-containing protein [Alphaproteobacteria bacterium]
MTSQHDQDIAAQIASVPKWYHRMALAPGVETPGVYAPAGILDLMGFPDDFRGKSVLDLGCADGFFSFEAERRGAARVLAVDYLPLGANGFQTAHRILGSAVEYRQLSVYDLDPAVIGTFDIVLFLGVFYHLRHPLLALDRIHAVCRERLFLETQVLDQNVLHAGGFRPLEAVAPGLSDDCLMQFYPYEELAGDPTNWFVATTACIAEMLRTSGFQPLAARCFGGRGSVLAARLPFSPPAWY